MSQDLTAQNAKNDFVICGDCRKIVPTLGKFNFIFADPPFNIGQDYLGYVDIMPNYELFTEEWVRLCWNQLLPNGLLALHGTDDLADMYLDIARRTSMERLAWINWHYRFGQNSRSNWVDSRAHCLIFRKSYTWTWNPNDVQVMSDRASTYADKRTIGFRLPLTIWGLPSDGMFWGRVQGNNEERCHSHPNQLPELYLARLIKAYTNPGDWILDPFGGSGTTAVVAKALKRNFITIDISRSNCESIEKRLQKGAVRV